MEEGGAEVGSAEERTNDIFSTSDNSLLLIWILAGVHWFLSPRWVSNDFTWGCKNPYFSLSSFTQRFNFPKSFVHLALFICE